MKARIILKPQGSIARDLKMTINLTQQTSSTETITKTIEVTPPDEPGPPFWTDNFVDTDGQLIGFHHPVIPITGDTYTQASWSSAGAAGDQASYITAAPMQSAHRFLVDGFGGPPDAWFVNIDEPAVDYYVSARVNIANASSFNAIGIIANADVFTLGTDASFLIGDITPTGGANLSVDGADVGGTPSFAAGVDILLRLDLLKSTGVVNAYVDGVLVATATPTTFPPWPFGWYIDNQTPNIYAFLLLFEIGAIV